MGGNWQIAWRFLIAKRKAMSMSLAGIVFGVAFFIVTQAQTAGFERFFIDTILGVNGAVRVQDRLQATVTSIMIEGSGGDALRLREGRSYTPGVEQPQRILEALAGFEAVSAASPVLRGDAALTSGFRTESARLLGVNLETYQSVSRISDQILFGSLNDFANEPDGILVGRRLAERLELNIGDFAIVSHLGVTRRFRVSAIFETGIDVYDKTHVFVHLLAARQVLRQPAAATYVQVALHDPTIAEDLAHQLEWVLGHAVASWQEREKSWLEVFRVLRLSSALSTSTILAIAGLGMFSTLAILVMERVREIAVLRSMGFQRQDIERIFLYQGIIVLAIGITAGFALGTLLTWGVTQIPIRIRGIFAADHFIVSWSIWHYVYAAVTSAVIVLLASLLPARRAARIAPADVIRQTAG